MSTNEFTYRSAGIKDKSELQELAIAAYGPFSALMHGTSMRAWDLEK